MSKNTAKKASQEDWHPADILAALHKRGITLLEVARRHNIRGSSTLSKAMNQTAYPINEKRLADVLGLHPMDIWPTRYNADGTRKSFGLRALKSTQSDCQHNGNNRMAA
ncbi:helix-turn-helix domain-containing protein [Azonexus sp.]|uniref:helix-turn-helix domain-containing protein n=1 Tax=Azonexus sp. TaxID=1872668 RepID=UPI0027BA96C3|nr:helix-turn-helix domain-containing protein [Azonexus sp.]